MKKNLFHFYLSLLIACFLISISGCTNAMVEQKTKPAILKNSSAEYTKIISQTMSLALNGKQIRLEESAFLKSNQHVLEKKMFTDTNTNPADGLMLGIPVIHRFSLFTTAENNCFLVYEKTGKQYPLSNLKCVAL